MAGGEVSGVRRAEPLRGVRDARVPSIGLGAVNGVVPSDLDNRCLTLRWVFQTPHE